MPKNNSHKMSLIVVFLLLFFSILHLILVDADFRWKVCNNQATYTPDSIFSTDLDRALDTVKNNTALTSFSTTSVGSVTVLAICRGDVSAVGCQDCTHSATSEIRQYCPNTTSAQTWYTYCMIRYSNVDFLQKPNEIALLSLYDTRQAPHPEIFNEKVQALVKNLSVTAGAREKRFALGWTNVMDTFTLYGYLDCTRDLSSDNCTKCLVSTADNIRCCLGKWAVWLATATCQIQISLDNNFNLTLGGATEVFTNTTMMLEAPSVVVTRSKSNLRLVSLIFSIVVGVAGVLALVFVSLWLVMTKKRRKKKVSMDKRTQAGDVEETTTSENLGMIVSSYSYDFELLVAATDNFSTRNKLGAGGFGIVYKGRMPNGEEIAVKKLQDGSMQGTEEFSNEVMLLLRIQHRNLVKLMGYCFHGEEKMLVYEYLSNKSLDFIIFDRSLSALLDWPKRFNIILGVARGLLYLHEDSQPKIIHRDIKAGNVLLDQNMNPKISDFGLAKPFPEEQSRLRTRRIAGTVQVGYMAPEYAVRGVISVKSDVYSFGILLLEIISGRKNYDSQLEEPSRELLKLTWRLEREGMIEELVDVTIGSYPQVELLNCVRIGLMCCQESMQGRPLMSSVVLMLSSDSITAPLPGSRDNIILGSTSTDSSSIVTDNFSNNSVTLSLVSGR